MFRSIESSFWTDPTVKALPKDAKYLFLYLITGQQAHLSGIYYLPRVTAAHETGLSAPEVDRILDTLSQVGLVRIDQKLELVWVVNMLHYQGCGEKSHRAAANQLYQLHGSALIPEFIKRYPSVRKYYKPKKAKENDRVSDSPSQVGSSWPQEQEQDQEKEQETPPNPPEGGERVRPAPRSSASAPNLPDPVKAAEAAKHVVAAYQTEVSPTHTIAGGERAVHSLLVDDRIPEAALRAAVSNYAADCRQNHTEPRYRLGAAKFFGQGAWEPYREGVPPPRASPAAHGNNGHGKVSADEAKRRLSGGAT
jgi:hypothetical protein